MMIAAIIQSVCAALTNEFPDDTIYTESTEQGLNTPCFFVQSGQLEDECYFGRRYQRRNAIIIQYYPCSNDVEAECSDVLERLFYCLEYIPTEQTPLRGTKRKGELTDGIVIFTVNYDFFYMKPNIEPCMETVHTKTEVIGDENYGRTE